MSDDDVPASSSLLIVDKQHTALQQPKPTALQHIHKRLHHQHNHFHQRQAVSVAVAITEVTQTIAVIQQIDVDSNGSIYSTLLTPAPTSDASSSTPTDLPATTTPLSTPDSIAVASSSSSSSPPPPSSATAETATASSSTQSSSALSSSSSAVQTSIPSISIPPTTSPTSSLTFASLSASSNSTISSTLISGSSAASSTGSLSQTQLPPGSQSDLQSQSHFLNSNSTVSASSSPSSVSYAYLTSSGSSTYHTTIVTSPRPKSTGTSSSYFPDYSSSQTDPTSTGANGDIAGGSGATGTGATATNTAAAGSGTDTGTDGTDDSSAPTTPVIIGSVVSSIAGAAVIILVLLFVWRWRKRTRGVLPLPSNAIGERPSSGAAANRETPQPEPSGGGSGDMIERRSFAYAFPAALAHLAGLKRSSHRPESGAISSNAGSERGFYRVSGRKLPSVLQNGGDGYGGGVGNEDVAERTNTLSGTSFYRDSQGFYGGPGSPTLPVLQRPIQRDSGVPVMRPSPARTPVTEQGFFTKSPLDPPPSRPDLLGRSRPSQDGSNTSRFIEDV